MIYTINTDLIPDDISPSQFFLLVSLLEEPNTLETATDLFDKKYIKPIYDQKTYVLRGFSLTPECRDKVVSILESSYTKGTRSYKDLALKLKEVFPAGRKEGTSRYWSEGVALIEKRLKTFEKKYGSYSDEAILNAAKEYVKGFNGEYKFMRTLRYFIWRDERGADGEIENKSDLLTYLEHEGEEDTLKHDWTTELR